MRWLAELSEIQWDRVSDDFGHFSIVLIAVLVAWIALRKDTDLQQSERHFEFRDERAQFYSTFIDMMNAAFIRSWDWAKTNDSSDLVGKKAAQNAAMELDSQSYKIQIRAPNFVAHACGNMNGHVQTVSLLLLEFASEAKPLDEEYEKAKRNMLKAMRRDIDLIEKTRNRRAYSKLIKAEYTRYFAAANIEEPDK